MNDNAPPEPVDTIEVGPPLEPARVETLASQLLDVIRAHLRRGPPGREKIFEVLNALAFAAAPIIVGSGEDLLAARSFLDNAIDGAVADLIARRGPQT
jgi:hypothetical protein